MKTELATIATPYAEALLDLAVKAGDAEADRVLADLATVNNEIKATPDLGLILNHPSIKTEEKRKIILQLFSSKLKELTLRVLELLLDKRRLNLLPYIESQYKQLLNARKKIVGASLVCAEPLGDSAVANIKARLTEHLGKKLELEVKVDPSLIGGVILRLGDHVIDGSLKGKLANLERSLMSV
ncbi:MAG TPA: ATP synthase F1 subunit delta [Chroococcales cyanobacterium]